MKLRALYFTTTAVALAVPSMAQAAAEQPPSSNEIQEIIVTAEKREANVQKTAIAIDVLSADTLGKRNVSDISALQSINPGLQMATSTTATIITVRGVSGRDTTEIGDPAVAVNIDGIFLQRPTGMNAAFFDVDRIEVLRGPQGTLYGRNATGGVINVVTNKPTSDFNGNAAVTVGNYQTINTEGAVNFPVSDTLALRASFMTRSHKGYRNNSIPSTGDVATTIPGVGDPSNRASLRGDDENTKAFRFQALYKPNDQLSWLVSGTLVHQGGVGPVAFGQSTTIANPPTSWSQAKAFPLNTVGDLNVTRRNVSTQIDYDFGPIKATYLFGYVYLDATHLNDNDGTANNSTSRGFYAFRRGETSEDLSHEFRLASTGSGPLSWQIGGFLYTQDVNVHSLNYQLPYVLRNFEFDVHVNSKAVFGQVNYELTDKLKVSGGLRWSKDEKSRTGGAWTGPSLTATYTSQPTLTFSPGDGISNDSSVTYHAGIDYQIAPRSLIYAKIDKGYKSGGFTSINQYGPESVVAYEIGSKNRFLNNSMQLNLTAFHYDYTDQQVSTLTAAGTEVLNAGSSRVNGIEAQLDWNATANDKLDLSVNWLDAKYKDFAVRVGSANVQQSGNRLIQAPVWALAGGYEHKFEMANGGTVTPRVDAVYRTESYFTFFNASTDRQRPYGTLDVSLTYDSPDGNWSVQLYGRNVTNTVYLAGVSTGSFIGTNTYIFAAPATFGARAQVKF